jgi:hypothetical protein
MDTWSEWFDHDGNGCPCPGQWVQVRARTPKGVLITGEGIARSSGAAWYSRNYGGVYTDGRLILVVQQYRIRRPKGMDVLDELIREVEEV